MSVYIEIFPPYKTDVKPARLRASVWDSHSEPALSRMELAFDRAKDQVTLMRVDKRTADAVAALLALAPDRQKDVSDLLTAMRACIPPAGAKKNDIDLCVDAIGEFAELANRMAEELSADLVYQPEYDDH